MEIALGMIALGGMYVIYNGTEENNNIKETYQNLSTGKKSELPNAMQSSHELSLLNANDFATLSHQSYPNPNVVSDKYFDGTMLPVEETFTGFTNTIGTTDYQHNNMVPFYGGKMKGQVYDLSVAETFMDNMTGSGSQIKSKTEQSPLFQPQRDMQFNNGAPNMNDFYQSRVNPVMKTSNVKPFESVQVGPGLNDGFSSEGRNGYNSGMESREKWLPKNVDEMRVLTNPKLEYQLTDHEGPAQTTVKNLGIMGRMEKHNPDTFYIQSQDRWFTTTGQEKAGTLRAIEEVHETSRNQTTTGYVGSAMGLSTASATKGVYQEPKKINLAAFDVKPSYSRIGGTSGGTFAMDSHTNYSTNRSRLRQPDTMRSGFSIIKLLPS